MRQYDPTQPLIFAHVPKTAGTSIRQLYTEWFGDNLLENYKKGGLPKKQDLSHPPLPGKPLCVYGHFNRPGGFSVESYYPDITQFITILRNPWERAISGYFYRVKLRERNPDFAKIATMTLEQYLEGYPHADPQMGPSAEAFLPGPMDMHNFRNVLDERFVTVGITEALPACVAQMAKALGKEDSVQEIAHVNKAPRNRDIPDHLLAGFKTRNALEYAIYDHVAGNYL